MTQTADTTDIGQDAREHNFPGRHAGRTSGGAHIIRLKTRRRVSATVYLTAVEYDRLMTYSGLVCTRDPALASKLALAIRQTEEAYDEKKRLG